MVKKRKKRKETVLFKIEKIYLRIAFPLSLLVLILSYWAFKRGSEFWSNILVELYGTIFILSLLTFVTWIIHLTKKIKREMNG